MTESLTEEGEGRIFQWSRIKSVKMSKKELKPELFTEQYLN